MIDHQIAYPGKLHGVAQRETLEPPVAKAEYGINTAHPQFAAGLLANYRCGRFSGPSIALPPLPEATRIPLPRVQAPLSGGAGDPHVTVRVLKHPEDVLAAQAVFGAQQARSRSAIQILGQLRFGDPQDSAAGRKPPLAIMCLKRELIPAPSVIVQRPWIRDRRRVEVIAVANAQRRPIVGSGQNTETSDAIFKQRGDARVSQSVGLVVIDESGLGNAEDALAVGGYPEIALRILAETSQPVGGQSVSVGESFRDGNGAAGANRQ